MNNVRNDLMYNLSEIVTSFFLEQGFIVLRKLREKVEHLEITRTVRIFSTFMILCLFQISGNVLKPVNGCESAAATSERYLLHSSHF